MIDNTELVDKNSRGKDRAWSQRKKSATEMSEIMKLADLKKRANYVDNCADFLIFKSDGEHKFLEHALFCRDRFCPICNWRKSLRRLSDNIKLYSEVNSRHNAFHYMLTLTVQNCNPKNLKETIIRMQKAWDRLSRRNTIKKNFDLGYMKVLEITRNTKKCSKWYKTMHPHYHIVLSSNIQFSRKELHEILENIKAEWIETLRDDELEEHYQKHMQCELHQISDIEKIEYSEAEKVLVGNTESHSKSLNALCEVSKYSMKMNDLFSKTETKQERAELMKILAKELENVRNISFGGIVAEIARELNIKEEYEENEDLMMQEEKTEKICPICGKLLDQEEKYHYNRMEKKYRRVENILENQKQIGNYIVDLRTGEIIREISFSEKFSNVIIEERREKEKNRILEHNKEVIRREKEKKVQLKLFG